MPGNPYLEEIARLRREVADLRAEIAERDSRFDQAVEGIMRNMGMTVYQARLLAALATGEVMTRGRLEKLASRVDNEDPRHVDQQVKRIRRRNVPGLVITSIYGAGYCLEGDSLKLVRAAMGRTH